MAFDYTNYLEVLGTVDSDFDITDRAGNTGNTLQTRDTAGEWCLETSGRTPSSNTGPTANPTGRTNFIYTEASSPVASSVWALKRNVSFNASTQAVKLDIIYNLYIDTGSEFYVEYATVASPNETTDWTILETISGTNTDAWLSDTFDFSAQTTTTLWIRFRFNSLSAYTNDLAFSTWREYGVDKASSDQEGYRWRKDDGSETTASWHEAQDTDFTLGAETTARLRILVDTEGDLLTNTMRLQCKRDDEAASEWRDV